MAEKLTFLHAADLHLDSPFKGLKHVPEQIFSEIRESTFVAFERLITTAIHKEVDFVLLVGDLFDYKVQSLKAQMHLRKGFERLKAADIPVFLSFGNHDFIQGNKHPIEYPDNVHIFPNETVSTHTFYKNDAPLANIYGFSYEQQAVYENKALEFKIRDRAIPYHIAMLHGTLHGETGHNPYASFRLQDLLHEPFDYWALGHIHKRSIVQASPPVVYPGNIQGRHRNEQGEKGCYYVTLTGHQATLRFIPLQHIVFTERMIDLSQYPSIVAMEKALVEELTSENNTRRLIALHLETTEEQWETLGLNERLPELIELMNETLVSHEPWQYIYTYKTEIKVAKVNEAPPIFLEEIDMVFNEIDIHEALKPLYQHPLAKRHLEQLDEQEVIAAAKKLLKQELHLLSR